MPNQTTEDLVDTLKQVVDINLAEDGELDVKDDTDEPTTYDPKADPTKPFGEEYVEGEEHDYSQLDSDFSWNMYNDMRPGVRPWPIRDHSILYSPAAINRYNVDYYMNVARTASVRESLGRGDTLPGVYVDSRKAYIASPAGLFAVYPKYRKVVPIDNVPRTARYVGPAPLQSWVRARVLAASTQA